MKPFLTPALLLGFLAATTPALQADDWLFFRGPNYNGTSTEQGWSAEWGREGPTIAWRKNVGIGAASFVVAGDRVITTGNQDDEDIVWCLDADTGNELWTYRFEVPFEERMFEGGTASTPTIFEDKVYNLSYDGDLICLQLETGEEIWRTHVRKEFGGELSTWKYAGSPLVIGDRLFLDIGGNGNSTLCLDRNTGRKIWGVGNDPAGYATIIPFRHQNQPAALVFKAQAMLGISLRDGSELWRIPWQTSYDVNASSPSVIDGNRFLISSGYPKTGRAALYQMGRRPTEIWENDDMKTKMNSLVVHEGHAYGISEKRARIMCLNLDNGRPAWSQKGAGQYGNLIIVDGHLVILSDSGELLIAPATPDGLELQASHRILRGRCWVMPVLANGRLYAKNNDGDMVCVDLR